MAALQRAEQTEAELRYLADHDSLTGLLDRRRFRAELDQYVSFTARYGGQGAVMIVDIDGLKAVNDALGHHAGDSLIRQVAAMMRERVRATDIVARLSGDEFAVLMPQTDTAGALQLGEDLRAQVAEGARADAGGGDDQRRGHDVRRRGAAAPRRCWSPPTRRCTGRRRMGATRSPSSATRASPSASRKRQQTTAARIRDALTQERLSLQTQPIRSLASGGIERYELLLRMSSEDGELLPAASFIEAAERSGMVQELDRWVVGQRARAAGRARARGRAGLAPRQPLRRLADRHLGARVHRTPARRRRRRPRPLHLRDHRDGAASTTTTRRPASPTA